MLHHQSTGSGPPILLLPGLLGTIESDWQRFIQPIADMGYTVIAADLPGHGQSEMTKSLTMRVIVEEIERLLSGIHADPAVILGYSTGGYAGLSFALKHLGRVVGLWMHGTKFYWSGEEAENLAAELDAVWLEENNPDRLAELRTRHGVEKLDAILPWANKISACSFILDCPSAPSTQETAALFPGYRGEFGAYGPCRILLTEKAPRRSPAL